MIRKLVLGALTLVLVLAAASVTALFIFRRPTPAEFATADVGRPVKLPADEVAHFDARSEWWYYTGFLTGEDERRYGFELVFFKAYAPRDYRLAGILPLNWLVNPMYFAHLAVSDLGTKEHFFVERTNLPQVWSAGANGEEYRVWNGEWQAWGTGGEHHLRAAAGSYALRLDLDSARPPVLHGACADEALSEPTGECPDPAGVVQMGQGGTSYYYSYTDLRGAGLLEIDGERQAVRAAVWMDHQWGSWDIHDGYKGWDWFSLRLDDGTQVMLFDFRNHDGSLRPGSGGTWIAADGRVRHLAGTDFSLQVLERWTSPETGGIYPVKWQLAIPGQALDVTIEADFPDQEIVGQLAPIYWEGSVVVDGSVAGLGFVEMTGYAPLRGHGGRAH